MGKTETRAQDTYDTCPRCGEPGGTFRFCLSCGASMEVADQLGPAPDSDPTVASGPRRWSNKVARWRTAIVVFPLLGGLAVVAGVGAQMLTAEIPEPDPAPEVTCWDGAVVEEAGDCTAPSGQAGLRWVFPSFRPGRDDCVDVLLTHPEYTRPAMYECDMEVGAREVKVAYMQLAGVDPARRFFARTFPDSDRERVRTGEGDPYRYTWRQRTEDGFELAAMYIDFPYAVSINAPTAKHRDQALRKLEFRHPDRIIVAEPAAAD